MKRLGLLVLLLGLNSHLGSLSASIWYVDNSLAASQNDGTSWANAWTNIGRLYTSNSFIHPGDTVYFSGGAVSQTYYGQLNLASGAPGNPITYTMGQDAGHNGKLIFDAAGTNAYTIWLGPESNWVLNGNFNGKTNWVLKDSGAPTSKTGIVGSGNANGIITFLSFQDVGNGLTITGATNLEVNYCDFSRIRGDHAIAAGGASEFFDQVRIHHCSLLNYADSASGNGPDGMALIGPGVSVHDCTFQDIVVPGQTMFGQHPDAIQTGQSNMKIYNNFFHNFANACWEGNPFNRSKVWHDFFIYNNVFQYDNKGFSVSRCFEFGDNLPLSLVSNIFWLNNTFVDWPVCFGQGWDNNIDIVSNTPVVVKYFIQNNIFYNSGFNWVLGFGTHLNPNCVWGNGIECSYNNINAGPKGSARISIGGTCVGNYFVSQTSHASTGIPGFLVYAGGVGNDLHLSPTDAAAKGLGMNLSPYFSTDIDGRRRPSSGPWDIGAYQSPPVLGTTAPAPPTGLHRAPGP